jgi:hypothetical protein
MEISAEPGCRHIDRRSPHHARLYTKLGARNRAEATAMPLKDRSRPERLRDFPRARLRVLRRHVPDFLDGRGWPHAYPRRHETRIPSRQRKEFLVIATLPADEARTTKESWSHP